MSIETGKVMNWEDIKTIFTNLNNARQKYGYASLSVPDNTDKVKKTEVVEQINEGLTDLTSNSQLSSLIVLADIPDVNTLVRPLPMATLTRTISDVYTCIPYNGTNFSGYNGTNFTTNYSGYNGTNFTTNYSGYYSNNFTTNFSYYGSYKAGNNAYYSSYKASNNAYYGTNFTTNYSGYNGSYNGTNFTSNNSFRPHSAYYTGEIYSYKSGWRCSSVNSNV